MASAVNKKPSSYNSRMVNLREEKNHKENRPPPERQ